MMNWTVQIRKLDELFEHEKNARFLSKEQFKHLETSVAKFGLCEFPVINSDNTIIGGHQRLRVLKELGHYEVRCLVPDEMLSDQEVDELNIRLNKNTGDWDWDKLANEWDIDLLCEWGFSVKEFHDEGKGVKVGKPKITLEFEDRDSLEKAMHLVDAIQMASETKIKVKVKT